MWTVSAAGNISPAALTALMDAQDAGALPEAWVLELSSFQLETTETLNPVAATVLNVSDDHLDRYIDLDEYASVKARVFQSGAGMPCIQVLNRNDPRVCRMVLPDRQIVSFGLDAPAAAEDFGLRVQRGETLLAQGENFLTPLSETAAGRPAQRGQRHGCACPVRQPRPRRGNPVAGAALLSWPAAPRGKNRRAPGRHLV